MTLAIGSLCSGFGGLDMSVMDVLDAEVAWHAQHDPTDKTQAAAQVLARHWPDVPNHGDITTTDWSTVEPVDVLTAGFPCQPVSSAGHRKGTDDHRWIWPAVARAIRDLRPRIVLLENVAAIVDRGLEHVLTDLARLGFDAEWTTLAASEVGSPHSRKRWFCLAWPAAADPHDSGIHWRRAPRGRRGEPANRPVGAVGWGPFAPAVDHWERLTRPCPPALNERGRANPVLGEWLMGLPEGYVTGMGLSFTQEWKLIGNGVVRQQGAEALRRLLAAAGFALAPSLPVPSTQEGPSDER